MRVRIEGLANPIEAKPEQTLLSLLREAGCAPETPCGGHGSCGKCIVFVDGQEQLACRYVIRDDIDVVVPQMGATSILTARLDADPAGRPTGTGDGVSCAFDIGTTTVVCSLLSEEGRPLATTSQLNPQEPFGADVISRIESAREGKRPALTAVIRNGMNDLLLDACAEAGVDPGAVGIVAVVGNPCMQQLFLGMDVDNLATTPFAPRLTHSALVGAHDYLPAATSAKLQIVPDIAGYVGADTLACVLATRIDEAADRVIIVDIGTNGEMVFSDRGRMIACSTAAGPALEGANISCGMRGAEGAIDAIDERGLSVIGGGPARGICGSGLIDAAAMLLRRGWMNEHGRLLTPDHRFALTDALTLAQTDIRQLQLAKGAIRAGIDLLLDHQGLCAHDVDRCILAGAFGSFMNPESADAIGLLPGTFTGKVIAAGNLALAGAQWLACDPQALTLADRLAASIQSLDLATLPDFQDAFVDAMLFPAVSEKR